ncbi:MAG TPA: SigB/SigF/SigG family RNA polymerase sigma factor [Solirubrobacteraceae bacterium]|nr:SigB/SigF/SigG family RNA polymerase sigma factor [Solirubrobacteraceae bacterium]
MVTAIPPRRRTRRADDDAGRFDTYQRHRDRRLRDQLFTDYLPLADSCARRYRRRGEPDDDLMQVAGIGLLKAIDRYDPARGTCFSSYAVPTIVGELQRHFRDHGWTVRPPRGLQEDVLRMERERANLVSRLGREPTAAELAHAVGCTVEEVLEAREAARARGGTSLDAPVGDEDGATIADLVGDEDNGFARIDTALLADALIGTLSERDQVIVRLRFEQELTQHEIGRRIGCSQMQVSRLLRAALIRLRAEARAAGLLSA